jgi:excisionase family DNA binding protein
MDEVKSIAGRFPDTPAPPGPATAEERLTLMTMKDAAATLGVSASTMRRLADEGRLATVWTAGGHRRFPEEAVRRLAAEQGARPTIRPIGPPDEGIPSLPERLEAEGDAMAATAAAALYRGTKSGWFAGEDAPPEIRVFLAVLSSGAASGRYAGVLEASEGMMQRARLHSATLLESHTFLERLRDVILHSLRQAGASQEELAATRHLFAALQQHLLERHS